MPFLALLFIIMVMNVITEPLKDRIQTGRKIAFLARNFWEDLDEYGHLDQTLPEFYNYVKNIPYIEDQENEEVARPLFLLDKKEFPGLDCKKKAVLMSSFLEAHGEPWRLVTNSELPTKEIHHIFPQVKIDGEWYNVDATYSDYELYSPKPESTAAEELRV